MLESKIRKDWGCEDELKNQAGGRSTGRLYSLLQLFNASDVRQNEGVVSIGDGGGCCRQDEAAVASMPDRGYCRAVRRATVAPYLSSKLRLLVIPRIVSI